jgi:hypothetical protein
MFAFYWKVPENGFEWRKASPTGEEKDWLHPRGDDGRSDGAPEYRTYAPLENSALFKTFADIKQTREGILAFATQYGALGLPLRADVPSMQAEAMEIWVHEILIMQHAIQLWEALKKTNVTFISRFIQWSEDPATKRQTAAYAGPMLGVVGISETSLSIPPEIRSLFVPGDVIYPGWFALHTLINDCLMVHEGSLRLLWQQERGKLIRTLQIVPRSLIAAIWIQFAKAVEGGRDHQQCEECKKWFEISGNRRGDAHFCSDPCRFRAYRMRQKEARRLHATGVPPKDIAKQVGSDTRTVKGWIAKGK